MGLIKSALTSLSTTLGDSWKEYFYCDALDSNTVVKKGMKKVSKGSSNTSGSENIITNGSVIAVNEGQAMLIVENGKIVEFTAEAGAFTFDNSTEGSIFSGELGSGIKNSFNTFKKRFTLGGDTGKDQRVYFINTKELIGSKFGTAEPVPYDDPVYQSISIRYFGTTSLIIQDPIKFYINVSGNVKEAFYLSSYWDNALKMEFVTYMTEALAKLAIDGIKFNQIPQNQVSLRKYMNEVLDEEWIENRGIEIRSVGIGQITLDPKDKAKVDKIDEMRLLSNSANAAGRMAAAQANAMETAAGNSNGAMAGFMGMGFANQAGGTSVNDLFKMSDGQKSENKSNSINTWKCNCGTENTGKFCNDCGSKKPESLTWKCSCGTLNTGKFCQECGKPQPASDWTCECGTVNSGKFCSGCGKARG